MNHVEGDHVVPVPVFGDYFVNSGAGRFPRIIKWITNSTVSHAGVYVGDGRVIEARPGGAGYAPLEQFLGPENTWSEGKFIPTAGELEVRKKIVAEATDMLGIPYGFPDLLVIGMAQSRLGRKIDPHLPKEEQPRWVRRIMDTRFQICSELVDECYNRAGVHLFDDGRLHQMVSPGDLLAIIDGSYVPKAAA